MNLIIFDLDGTLINTIKDLRSSMNKVLEMHKFPLHSQKEYTTFVGHGLREFVELALPEMERKNVNKYIDEFSDIYKFNCVNETELYKFMPELLNYISNSGIKMAILSNKEEYLVNKIAKVLLTKWNFEIIAGSVPKYPNKPDPCRTLDILERLNESPENSVFIGDSEVDIETAKKSGMRSIGVTWGYGEVDKSYPDLVVNSPKEIIDYLKKGI